MPRFTYRSKPYKHQAEDFPKYRNKKHHAYLWDVDTGKTWITIQELAYHFIHKHIDLGIVIAPKGMYHQWLDEWYEHSPISGLNNNKDVVRYQWSSVETLGNKRARKMFKDSKLPKLLVMNAEALSTDKGRKFLEEVMKGRTTYMALDESSMFRNPKAKRTKAICRIGLQATYRRILTGTPASNSPLNLWSQFQFLDSSIFNCNFFYFKQQFAILKQQFARGGHKFFQVLGYRNLDILEKMIAPYCSQREREKCFDMPPKSYRQIEVELTTEQKQAYKEMVEQFIVETETGICTATMALTQNAKLRQISCGFMYLDDPLQCMATTYEFPGTDNRLSTLMDLLSMIKGKVIIWADFVHTLEKIEKAICNEYGENAMILYGKGNRSETQQRFNEDKECRFFVSNPATGKYGLNLKPALNMVFYTTSYDLEQRIQCEGRMRERKRKLTVWDIVATGTVEDKIRKSLIGKSKIAKSVMGQQWKEWLLTTRKDNK
jgi:SNF2 family DNA or RNA helicase